MKVCSRCGSPAYTCDHYHDDDYCTVPADEWARYHYILLAVALIASGCLLCFVYANIRHVAPLPLVDNVWVKLFGF